MSGAIMGVYSEQANPRLGAGRLALAESGWSAVVNAQRRNDYAARCRQHSSSPRASEALSRIQSKVARKGSGDGGKEQEHWFL